MGRSSPRASESHSTNARRNYDGRAPAAVRGQGGIQPLAGSVAREATSVQAQSPLCGRAVTKCNGVLNTVVGVELLNSALQLEGISDPLEVTVRIRIRSPQSCAMYIFIYIYGRAYALLSAEPCLPAKPESVWASLWLAWVAQPVAVHPFHHKSRSTTQGFSHIAQT
jgi:hypothetical protein